ncbi:MAG: hypothetical protein ACR2OL_07525 [Anderseniella sp.]
MLRFRGAGIGSSRPALVGLGILNTLYLARKRATARVALISLASRTGALVCAQFIGYL